MTMQEALDFAHEADLFARPRKSAAYVYKYVQQRRNLLIHVFGRDRFGVFQGGMWRTLTKQEIEADWILCDRNGSPIDPSKPRGLSLHDLIREALA